MSRVTLSVDIKEIESAIKLLSPQDKVRLVETLEKDTWHEQLRSLTNRIRQKARRHPVSDEEIDRVCDEVRHKRRAHRCH